MRPPALLPLLLPLLTAVLHTTLGDELTMLGPSLVAEPASRVPYVTSRGATLQCAARGDPPPAISWLSHDGAALIQVPGIRRIHKNGTLEVLPTPGAAMPPAATVRCRAANKHGVALSRYVTLQPVSEDAPWEVEATAAGAGVGGVAAILCDVTPHQRLVSVRAWYRANSELRVDPPTTESRYIVAGDTLLIRDVTLHDAGVYSCEARHSLTDTTRRSRPAILTVNSSPGGAAPRAWRPRMELEVASDRAVCLPCAVTGLTHLHYTWYREEDGRLSEVAADEGNTWLWAGGAALCGLRTGGARVCRAGDSLGDASARVELRVLHDLNVTVTPVVIMAEAGGMARFQCTPSLADASLSWLHDGVTTGAGPALEVVGVARHHRGVYQCLASHASHASRGEHSAQAAAELRLTAWAPELSYTFIEQALRPGGDAVLRCAAAGAPPARLAWLRDGAPLPLPPRYSLAENTAPSGDVTSTLNISNVQAADGGRYTCRATNPHGIAEHSARLNIYGPPMVRALGPVRLVAGTNATVHCPYAGYPISDVWWWGTDGSLVEGAGRVSAQGEALRLCPVLARDAGAWTCGLTGPAHTDPVRRHIDIVVRNPPKISPFLFSSELTEGSSAQVLCGVSSGDKPLYFSWLKDGAPIPTHLQVEEKSVGEFSLLMLSGLSARHSGAYTCRVSNVAAHANYTAVLSVNVSPAWSQEPGDVRVVAGAPLHVPCVARGHPPPTVVWHRRLHGGAGAERWEAVGAEGPGGAPWVAGGALRARGASRALAGAYRCGADNGVPPALHKVITITVLEAARLEQGPVEVRSVAGRGAALECAARGDDTLALHWERAGRRLPLDRHRWSVSEERRAGSLRSTLRTGAVRREDGGAYRCVAHNQHGRDHRTLHLLVLEPPEAPTLVKLAGLDTRWVRVAWTPAPRAALYHALCGELRAGAVGGHTGAVGGSTAPRVNNLTLDAAAHDPLTKQEGGTLSARVEGLRPATAHSLRLFASNDVGSSPHSDPLFFTTLEEAPSAPPQNVQVTAGAAGELHVSWSAPPQDTWNGELVGYVTSWRELDRLEDDDEEEASDSMSRSGCVWSDGADGGGGGGAARLGGLRGALYAVSVRAYTRAGGGPPSPARRASPSPAPPPSPRRLVCRALAPRALTLSWFRPSTHLTSTLTGYDLNYTPIDLDISQSWGDASGTVRVGAVGAVDEATLKGLLPATNHSVWVRARSDAGLGPPSTPVYCTTTDDVPETIQQVGAIASGPRAVRVTWLPPRGAPPTHYTLYAREAHTEGDAVGAGREWSQRVEARGAGEEVWREVGGLRERAHHFWVRGERGAGAGPPSRTVLAAPNTSAGARVTSLSRVVWAVRGARVRLRCGAVGAPPLRRHWTPQPPRPHHALTEDGDLIIHELQVSGCVNYTCSVRNSVGADSLVVGVCTRDVPPAPALRLVRTTPTALRVSWGTPPGGALLGYTLAWARGSGPPHSRRLPPADTAHTLMGLACGAAYTLTLRAHNHVGDSPPSAPLHARTLGDKARPPSGREVVWANSSALRVSLASWARVGSCPVRAWRVAVREAGARAWAKLHTIGDTAEAGGLRAGAWYEVSVQGDVTLALYRAATLTCAGERLGEVEDVPVEAPPAPAPAPAPAPFPWRAPLAPALLAVLALLLAALTGVVVVGRRGACVRRGGPPPSAELCNTNGKILTPPDVTDEVLEISPYATFSMSSVEAAGGCAVHVVARGGGAPRGLGAPPPRPNLLAHNNEYGPGPDTDSESSGSPCAACAARQHVGEGARGEGARGAGARGADSRGTRRRHPAPLPTARRAACGVRRTANSGELRRD